MKKRVWWGLGTVLLVALATVGWWLGTGNQKPLSVSTETVKPVTMQENLYATGDVVPDSRQQVQAVSSGLVSKVAVKTGDSVKQGQLLVSLDSTLADAQVAQAQANVDAAQASVNAAQTSVKAAQKSLSNSSGSVPEISVYPQSSQAPQSAQAAQASQNAPDTQSTQVSQNSQPEQVAQVSQASQVSQVSQTLQVSQAEETLAQAKAALTQAQEALHVAQVQKDQLNYKAVLSGTVLEVNAEAGSLAPVQQPLVVVADLTRLNVVVQLNEIDAGKVRTGGKVTVTSKTLGNAAVTGVIENIAPEAVVQLNAQANSSPTVEMTIRLDKAPSTLKPGYNVNVQAVVATKKGVLAVPQEALFQVGDNNYVYRIQDGRLQKAEVGIGIGDNTNQEITSGLKTGDLIVVNPSSQLSEGMRVTSQQGSGGA